MRVLILGSGGREHALGWKIAQSPQLEKLYFLPGNPATGALGENLDNATDPVPFAYDNNIDLVVVGPEQPLVDGIADRLSEAGVPCFGPCKAAAQLEGSKAFAKDVMSAAGVPTAAYASFDDYDAARAYVKSHPMPVVIKADGLAGGKGVVICQDLSEAEKTLYATMKEKCFGEAGDKVVIEEFLTGTEASFHVICDGANMIPLISAQDHKALYDGNRGPNTGGMGTFAPSPQIPPALAPKLVELVARPVLNELEKRGCPFRGVLFVGLMMTDSGPKVLEYNVRFGDPETQVIMSMLDFDLLPVLHAAANGALPEHHDLKVKAGAAVCVVLAASGYPSKPRKGDIINGLENESADATVFYAGVDRDGEGRLITSGGRVLGVTAQAENLERARKKAYSKVKAIHFEGIYFRRDIGGLDD